MASSRLTLQTALDTFLSTSVTTADAANSNTSVTKTIQSFIDTYLNAISSNNYTTLQNALKQYKTDNESTAASGVGLRLLITHDDGGVAFDVNSAMSSGLDASFSTIGVVNTSTGKYYINENHMSRPEIMLATLSNNGVGYSKRYSSSSSAYLQYVAYRVGNSTEVPSGCIRASVAV